MKLKTMVYMIVGIVFGIICFYIGFKYSRLTEDQGSGKIFLLNEDMRILNERDEMVGSLKKGMLIYLIPDRWGDENYFKAYFRVYNNDLEPIKIFKKTANLKKYPRVEFILKKD